MEEKSGMIKYFIGSLFIMLAAIKFVSQMPSIHIEAPPPHGTKVQLKLNTDVITPKPNTGLNHTGLKSILFWTTVFGARQDKTKILDCKPHKCYMTGDQKNPENYDALIFHTRDSQNPPKIRKPNQVYVAYTWESPRHPGRSYIRGNFYNWSITYMRESTLPFLHGGLSLGKAKIQIQDLPQMKKNRTKSKAVITWVVSNCRASSRRRLYVNKLKKYMAVDVYGGCGTRCPAGTGRNSVECYDAVSKSGKYKFYLAFENSACKDYISLKPFRALQAGLVPIVFGGLSASDYTTGLLPPHSFIDVRNFTSPKHLSEYLKMLDKNDVMYLEYHAWRNNTRVGGHTFDWCDLCRKLYDKDIIDKHITLNWGAFWNPSKLCDRNLVNKVMG